ncbi:hypothetical protein ACH50P_17990, partial [Sulfitobacter sp. M22386]
VPGHIPEQAFIGKDGVDEAVVGIGVCIRTAVSIGFSKCTGSHQATNQAVCPSDIRQDTIVANQIAKKTFGARDITKNAIIPSDRTKQAIVGNDTVNQTDILRYISVSDYRLT